MKRKVRHTSRPKSAIDSLAKSFPLFDNNLDGRLRLAAVAFIAIGVSFLMWQSGMLPISP